MDAKIKFLGTRQVASLLGIRPSALNQAVWDNRVPAPSKGPGDAYWWTEEDVRRAAKVFGVKLPVEKSVDGVDVEAGE